MTPTGRESLVSSFFTGTGSSYDEVAKLFTLGLDRYWKAEIVKLVPKSDRVLDLGCGTGILTECLATKNPAAEIVGVDITPDYLAAYQERLRRKPWIHARSILGNAESIALDGEFDVIASSYLAKYVDPGNACQQCHTSPKAWWDIHRPRLHPAHEPVVSGLLACIHLGDEPCRSCSVSRMGYCVQWRVRTDAEHDGWTHSRKPSGSTVTRESMPGCSALRPRVWFGPLRFDNIWPVIRP